MGLHKYTKDIIGIWKFYITMHDEQIELGYER